MTDQKYYQELTILPDPEISPYFIWQKLYTQIHLALVKHAKASYGENATYGDIGVSFPAYRCFEKNGQTISFLGEKLRLFADSSAQLEQLNLSQWLERLTDYVHIKSIQEVPAEHGYITVSRARQDRNLERVARRRASRKNESLDEARANIIHNYAEKNGISIDEATKAYKNPTLKAYPYINMQSLEGKQRFSLEIKQSKATAPHVGTFNTYGLSATNTVPHWEERR